MALFFAIFFSIYAAINYYIFIRGWQALSGVPHLRIVYSVVFIILFASYILAKLLVKFLPAFLYDIMLWSGSFWFAFMIYFFLAVICIDLVRFVLSQLNLTPEYITQNYVFAKRVLGIAVVASVTLTVLLGFINTTKMKVTELNIKLHKGKSHLSSINAVMFSDIHLSPMDNEKFLSKIVKKINQLKPDIIFVPGDLFDDHAHVLNERNIGKALFDLKPKYGIYASTGNHEFINGIDSAVAYMKNHGLKVIRDSSVLIGNSFYIVARDDRAKKQFTGENRKSLGEITADLDREYPAILMDHTPLGLNEAEKEGIDLQLSGHTHHGQMFPANLITKMIYEKSWGYLKKGKTQYYVSCGVGTWGPRVRIGSRSEIVHLKINFVD